VEPRAEANIAPVPIELLGVSIRVPTVLITLLVLGAGLFLMIAGTHRRTGRH
jgi:hypothetical protein